MKRVLFATLIALTGMTFAQEAPRPVKVSFDAPGGTTLYKAHEVLRISVSLYFRDLFKQLPRFQWVSWARSECAWKRIHAGSYDFGSENAYERFTHFIDTDIVIDYYYLRDENKAWMTDKPIMLEVWNGPKKGACVPCSGRVRDYYAVCAQLSEMLIQYGDLTPEEEKIVRAFIKNAKQSFDARFVLPRVYGHYDMNTGRARIPGLRTAYEQSHGEPYYAARLANGAALFFTAGGKSYGMSPQEVHAVGVSASLGALGHPDEELARPFIELQRARMELEPQYYALAHPLTLDAMARAMESDMNDSSADETDGMLADDALDGDGNAEKAQLQVEDYGISKETRALSAMKSLGWQKSAKALKEIFPQTAKSKEEPIRRVTAYALSCYETKETDAWELLKTLATDKDPLTASIANAALIGAKMEPSENAADSARKALAMKDKSTGIVGVDAEYSALIVLAQTGAATDRAYFEKYSVDANPQHREEAARGLFKFAPYEPQDLRWLSDPDAPVVRAALQGLKPEVIKSNKDLLAKMYDLAARDTSSAILTSTLTALRPCRPQGGVELDEFRMRFENLYARRRLINTWAEKKDSVSLEMLAKATDNSDVSTRAHAFRMIKKADPKRARECALKHLSDPALYVRLYASIVMADLAESSDANVLKDALAKEKNRVIKLYYADAVAKAEGKPKPAPLPHVNSVIDRGWATSWMCGGPGNRKGFLLNDGYYDLSVPHKPTEEMIYAHDVLKAAFFPRPTPIHNPGLIAVSPADADSFWTELDSQLPPGVIEYVDGFVYGEETMGLDPNALWYSSWALFCEDANLDATKIAGNMKNLDANEKCAWTDWATAVAIEGYNELYEFTKDYVGKLRPGILTCSYGTDCSYGATPYARKMKFDLYGLYLYSGDARGMYAVMRSFRSIWPERPTQWLSLGAIEGAPAPKNTSGEKDPSLIGCYTNALAFRSHQTYVDSFSVWLAGSDTGYFTTYWIGQPFAAQARDSLLGQQSIYPGSKEITTSLDKYFEDADKFYLNRAKDRNLGAQRESEDFDTLDTESVELDDEEMAVANLPEMREIPKRKAAMARDLLLRNRAGRDTTCCELGLKRRYPGHYECFFLGSCCYSPTGMLLPSWDQFFVVSQPSQLVGLQQYKMGVVGGGHAKARMDEQTRQDWISWLRDKSVVLVVNGDLSRGTSNAYCTASYPHGNLKTLWPWENDVGFIEEKRVANKKIPARYEIKTERAKELARDEYGVTRVRWQAPDFKGTVVFDMTEGPAVTNSLSMRKILVEVFKEKKIDLELSEIPGMLKGEENGLTVQTMSWHGAATNTCSGFDLLTGVYNPILSQRLRCVATAEDYVAPCVAVHGGVCVIAQDNYIEVLEKLPNGVKVAIKGLARITTKSGKPPKISGKELPEIVKDPIGWYVERENEEGITNLKAQGQCNETYPWRVLRVTERTELTITD